MKYVRIIFTFVMTVALLSVLPIFSFAAADTVTWDISQNGDNSVTATLNKNSNGLGKHELVISGNGQMRSFYDVSNVPWNAEYSESLTSVVIEEGVTYLSENALYYCYGIEYVTVKSINMTFPAAADNVIPYAATVRAHAKSTAAAYADSLRLGIEYICEFDGNVCSVCEYECTTHTGGAPTCLEGAKCEVCGSEYGEPSGHDKQFVPKQNADCGSDGNLAHYICSSCGALFDGNGAGITAAALVIPASHSFGELVEAANPTCTKHGNYAYYHCNVCNKNFDESYAPLDVVYIPATGIHSGGLATCTAPAVCDFCNNPYGEIYPYNHTFSRTLTHDSSNHWYACQCGEKNLVAAHSYTDSITKPATENEEGIKTRTCACGYTATETIPRLEPTDNQNPDINDEPENEEKSTYIIVIIAVSLVTLLLVGVGIFVAVRIRKSKNRKDS